MNPLTIGVILVIALAVLVLIITIVRKSRKQLVEKKTEKKAPLPEAAEKDAETIVEASLAEKEEDAVSRSQIALAEETKAEEAELIEAEKEETEAKTAEPSLPPTEEVSEEVPPSEKIVTDESTIPSPDEIPSLVEESVAIQEAAEDQAAAEREKQRREKKLKKLRQGLAPTRSGLFSKISDLFRSKKEIDPSILEDIEDMMLVSDVGAKTTDALVSAIRSAMDKDELSDSSAAWSLLKEAVLETLTDDSPPIDVSSDKPFVIMVVGVNGVGKTTTIGKLATTYSEAGKKVVLAAGDTFRAAAVNQLSIWGQRANAEVVKSKEGADPSSVVFDAIKKAKEIEADIVIADTAGRLHTQQPLMEELKKIHRVIGKAKENAPHEVLLVLDATTGQNAIQQVGMFKDTLEVTGLVLTKLDGTAKGGVIIGVCHEHSVPVRYIGIGEARDDLREFIVSDFVDALFYGDTE